ncbi:hypothetical protein ABTM93_19660, partial [Acinetobacter baumannii]
MVGQLVNTESGQQQFQTYLTTAIRAWVQNGARFAGGSSFGNLDRPMLNFSRDSASIGRIGGMDLRFKLSPQVQTYGF